MYGCFDAHVVMTASTTPPNASEAEPMFLCEVLSALQRAPQTTAEFNPDAPQGPPRASGTHPAAQPELPRWTSCVTKCTQTLSGGNMRWTAPAAHAASPPGSHLSRQRLSFRLRFVRHRFLKKKQKQSSVQLQTHHPPPARCRPVLTADSRADLLFGTSSAASAPLAATYQHKRHASGGACAARRGGPAESTWRAARPAPSLRRRFRIASLGRAPAARRRTFQTTPLKRAVVPSAGFLRRAARRRVQPGGDSRFPRPPFFPRSPPPRSTFPASAVPPSLHLSLRHGEAHGGSRPAAAALWVPHRQALRRETAPPIPAAPAAPQQDPAGLAGERRGRGRRAPRSAAAASAASRGAAAGGGWTAPGLPSRRGGASHLTTARA